MKKTNILSLLFVLLGLALVTGCTPNTDTPEAPEETTYTVSFNTNGGSDVTSQTVKSGEKVTKPIADPIRGGYRFDGWYTSNDDGKTLSDSAFDFNTEIKSDITLYAKWTDVEPEPEPEPETPVDEPETPAEETPAEEQPTNNAPTLYSITITQCDNGTVTASKTSQIEADKIVTLTINPATGYELDTLSVKNGDTEITVTNNQFTMSAGNVTVSATFKLIKYKVTYAAYTENGEEILAESTANFEPGATLDKEVSISDVAYVKYSGTMGNADITLEPELWLKVGAPVIFIRGSEEINVGGIHENTPFFSKNLDTGAINLKESVLKNMIYDTFENGTLNLYRVRNAGEEAYFTLENEGTKQNFDKLEPFNDSIKIYFISPSKSLKK